MQGKEHKKRAASAAFNTASSYDALRFRIASETEKPGNREFLSAREAAIWLGVPLRSLHHYVRQSLLPSYKLGRHRLFRKAELLFALDADRTATRGETFANDFFIQAGFKNSTLGLSGVTSNHAFPSALVASSRARKSSAGCSQPRQRSNRAEGEFREVRRRRGNPVGHVALSQRSKDSKRNCAGAAHGFIGSTTPKVVPRFTPL